MTGTIALTRLILRRDRTVLAGWILMIALVGFGTTSYYLGLFGTEAARMAFTHDAARTPALLAFNGRLYDSSLGVLSTWRMRDMSYTLIGLMAVLTVIRHTRAEEETGRQELVGAAVVGRIAPLTSALIVSVAMCVIASLFNALGMVALGLDAVGSLAYVLTAAATGAVFAAVGALAAQVAERSRDAIGIGALVLGAAYVVRFVADGSGLEGLKWLTPLGWAHLARPFADERWGVPLLSVLLAAILVGAAYVFRARRDFGAGLLPARLGPARGRLGSSLALAGRLHQGLLLGWIAGFAVAGLFFGGLAAGVRGSSDGVMNSPHLHEFMERYSGGAGASMGDTFLWVIALTLGYMATLYPALAVLRLRTEESSGRAELLLSAPVDRVRWAGGHVMFGALGTVAVLAAGGLAAGLVFAGRTGDPADLARIFAGALIQVPAAWVLGAITMLAFGLLPRIAAAVAWIGFMFIQLFEVVGPIAGIDFAYVESVIPFWHLPRILAGGDFSAAPLLVLTAISATMVLIGLATLRRRDAVQAT